MAQGTQFILTHTEWNNEVKLTPRSCIFQLDYTPLQNFSKLKFLADYNYNKSASRIKRKISLSKKYMLVCAEKGKLHRVA